jgi:hypothetical protein
LIHQRANVFFGTPESRLTTVTAQPIEDPWDPLVIQRGLPEPERELFLRQYHEAVEAAHDPAGYGHLRQLLRVWSLTALATSQPGYYEELAAVQNGTAQTVPASEAIADWDARLAAAKGE